MTSCHFFIGHAVKEKPNKSLGRRNALVYQMPDQG